jgi:hypothetical protein
MLDDDQTRRDNLDDQAEGGDLAGRAPDVEIVARPPHAEVNTRPLDRGRNFRQHGRRERQLRGEEQRMARLIGRQERERDLRRLSLFPAQARPERRVDDRGDRLRWRRDRRDGAIRGARGANMLREVSLHRVGNKSSGGIGGLNHLSILMLTNLIGH